MQKKPRRSGDPGSTACPAKPRRTQPQARHAGLIKFQPAEMLNSQSLSEIPNSAEETAKPSWKRSHRIRQGDQKSVCQIPTALQEKADPHEIWPVRVSRSSVENSKKQAALFQEGRDRILTITCRSQKGLEEKTERGTEDF